MTLHEPKLFLALVNTVAIQRSITANPFQRFSRRALVLTVSIVDAIGFVAARALRRVPMLRTWLSTQEKIRSILGTPKRVSTKRLRWRATVVPLE